MFREHAYTVSHHNAGGVIVPKKLTRNVAPSRKTRFRSGSGEARSSLRRDKGLRIEPLEPRLVLSGGLLITEFMADNDGAWPDGDGNYEDWIEIHNPTVGAISLDGWYLTDDYADLTQWPFPDMTIDPGQYMVVVASSQPVDNYVDAGGYLHTSFALKKTGEYLFRIADDFGM